MMDLLKSAKFNVITIDGKILLTIKIEDKEHSFTLNWDGKQDYWRTIEIGKYYFDVNVWIEGGTRRTSAYPVIDGETVMTDFFPIYSEPLQKEEESKQKYYFVVVHELNNDKEYSISPSSPLPYHGTSTFLANHSSTFSFSSCSLTFPPCISNFLFSWHLSCLKG